MHVAGLHLDEGFIDFNFAIQFADMLTLFRFSWKIEKAFPH
jgi:hypothetical protein